MLFLLVLAAVNAYVFLWHKDATLARMGELPNAVVERERQTKRALPPFAETPELSCTNDPVNVFAALTDTIQLETSLTGGNTLRLSLLELGVESIEIDKVEAAVRTKVDLGLLGSVAAPVRVALDRHGAVLAIEVELAEGHVLQGCRRGEQLEARNIQHPLRSDVIVVGLELGPSASLHQAVIDAEEAPELARHVAEALAYDVDFMTEARPGDRVQVMVEKRWLGRVFHRYGAVLAIRYVGAAGRVAYYRYKAEGMEEAFFNYDGEPMRRALRRSPVRYHRVNPEARALLVPTIEIIAGRLGAAYRLPEGAPIVALADATVVHAGTASDDGVSLELEEADGPVIRYAHMMRLVGELEVGDRVSAGQVVGLAGHSGKTATNRVRIEAWRGQEALDPMVLTATGSSRPERIGATIPKPRMDRFRRDIKPWRRALRRAR